MHTPYLRGWKEIANYLRSSVRTVQRYERMGLPVHRIGNVMGSVFAIGSELDAWLLSKPSDQSAHDAVPAQPHVQHEQVSGQQPVSRQESAPKEQASRLEA